MLIIGTTGTETRFLPEAELPDYARNNPTSSESMKEHEDAMTNLGGEDVGLAKAIEESVRESRKQKGGSKSNSNSSSNACQTESRECKRAKKE